MYLLSIVCYNQLSFYWGFLLIIIYKPIEIIA